MCGGEGEEEERRKKSVFLLFTKTIKKVNPGVLFISDQVNQLV